MKRKYLLYINNVWNPSDHSEIELFKYVKNNFNNMILKQDFYTESNMYFYKNNELVFLYNKYSKIIIYDKIEIYNRINLNNFIELLVIKLSLKYNIIITNAVYDPFLVLKY